MAFLIETVAERTLFSLMVKENNEANPNTGRGRDSLTLHEKIDFPVSADSKQNWQPNPVVAQSAESDVLETIDVVLKSYLGTNRSYVDEGEPCLGMEICCKIRSRFVNNTKLICFSLRKDVSLLIRRFPPCVQGMYRVLLFIYPNIHVYRCITRQVSLWLQSYRLYFYSILSRF